MTKPAYIIDFQGTQISQHRLGLPVKDAVVKYKKDNNVPVLFLCGPGAQTNKMEGRVRSYAPGVFTHEIDEKSQKIKQTKKTFRLGGTFYRVAGLIRGTGEEDNLKLALAHVEQLVKKTPYDPEHPLRIKLSGFSRGGASAIALANEIYKRYGTSIRLDLFVSDANPGPGRKESNRKINIPPNVDNAIFTFSTEETSSLYRPEHGLSKYVFANAATNARAMYFQGTHLNQNIQPIRKAIHPAAAANAELMRLFLNDQTNSINNETIDLARDPSKYDETLPDKLWVPEEHFKHLNDALINNANALNKLQQDNVVQLRRQLNHDCYLLFCKLWREYNKPGISNSRKTQINNAVNATEALLNYVTRAPGSKSDGPDILLNKFQKAMNIDGMGTSFRWLIARICASFAALCIGAMTCVAGAAYGALTFNPLNIVRYSIAATMESTQATHRWFTRKIEGNTHARNVSNEFAEVKLKENTY